MASRCGVAYLAVLSVTTIICVISYAALTNVRILRRDVMQSNDSQEATWLAFSGMENAIACIANDVNWRTTYTNNVEIAPVPFGRGSFSWRLVDTDGNLADDARNTQCGRDLLHQNSLSELQAGFQPMSD
jgi:type II secretory pathway component PulK